MTEQENGMGFWKEVRRQKQDIMNSWMAVKDSQGQRILDPNVQKEVIADYFQQPRPKPRPKPTIS